MQKQLFILALLLTTLFFSFTYSQKKHTLEDEIEFHEGNWESLLAKAKRDGKPFFVDVYTTWCGPCKKMEKITFKNKEVADYAKKNFIAYRIDAEKGEGTKIAREYKVRAYPTLLFFDKNGKKTGKVVGYADVERMLYLMEKYK